MSATVIGHHGGRSSLGKARQMTLTPQRAARVGDAAATSTSRSRTARTS